MYSTHRNSRINGGFVKAAVTPFCKVCYDAGLPHNEVTSHFVKDQPGPNGKVVCPTLLAQKCLICGVPGHTSSYCPDNSSVSSSSSTIQNQPRHHSNFTMAVATDEIRYPPNSIRLPPIQFQKRQQNNKPIPRIVYPDNPNFKTQSQTKPDFPSLPNLPLLRRFENDEPMLKRGGLQASPVHSPAEASPVHSPVFVTNIRYNKKNNPFGDLDNDKSDSDKSDSDISDDENDTMFPPISSVVVTKGKEKENASSWASIAAGNKRVMNQRQPQQPLQPQQPQRTRSRFSIVIPSGSGPLLPPISFKPKPEAPENEKNKQVKKMWGDTDSEDDEEFLKRGIE